jgi:tetratricopeptide (TPR) repeat protein
MSSFKEALVPLGTLMVMRESLIEAEPDAPAHWNKILSLRAQCSTEIGDHETAISAYKELLVYHLEQANISDALETAVELSGALCRLKRYSEAIHHFQSFRKSNDERLRSGITSLFAQPSKEFHSNFVEAACYATPGDFAIVDDFYTEAIGSVVEGQDDWKAAPKYFRGRLLFYAGLEAQKDEVLDMWWDIIHDADKSRDSYYVCEEAALDFTRACLDIGG